MTPLGNNLLRTQLQFLLASKPKNSSLPLFAQLSAIFALKLSAWWSAGSRSRSGCRPFGSSCARWWFLCRRLDGCLNSRDHSLPHSVQRRKKRIMSRARLFFIWPEIIPASYDTEHLGILLPQLSSPTPTPTGKVDNLSKGYPTIRKIAWTTF